MQSQYWRLLVCSLGSALVGVIAAVAGAGVTQSIVIGLMADVLALSVSNLDHMEQEIARLAAELRVGQAIHDSRYRRSLERLLTGIDSVRRRDYPLFVNWIDESLTSWAARVQELGNGHLRITSSSEIQERGRWLLQNLQESLFATSFVSMHEFWTDDKGLEYQEENAEFARKHPRKITRVFLFPTPRDIYEPRFQAILNTLRQQDVAGVNVLYAFTADLPEVARVDVGIWDDKMACYLTADPADPAQVLEANYYTGEAEMQEARRVERTIRASARPISEVLSTESELMMSARITRADADDYCLPGGAYPGSESCGWYHASWQHLRLLDLVETPRLHYEFFVRYLRKMAETSDQLRVLVCGLADYEMLKVVLQALDTRAGLRHTVRVIDSCNTPIRNTQWYLDHVRPRVHVVAAVGLAEDTKLGECSYDLVVTDAFLSKLPYERQAATIAEWKRILRPGGEILTTMKLAGPSGPGAIRASDEQVARYVERAVAKAKARAGRGGSVAPLPVDVEDVRGLAEGYARRNVSYPVAHEGLAPLFWGFDVEVLDAPQVEEYSVTSYAQVIAVKLGELE
jgi:SAM-dependent methyltransferase